MLHDPLRRSSLDSDTAQQIQIGIHTITDTTRKFLVNAEVESAFWGCYVLLFIMAVQIQCKNGLKSFHGRIIFGVTCLLFISSTSLWAMDLVLNRELTDIALSIYDDPSASPEEWLVSVEDKIGQVAHRTNSLLLPRQLLFVLNMVISDAVVIWRTYAIWNRRRAFISLPVISLLAALGFAFVQLFVCDLELLKHGSTTTRICNMRMPMFITFILSLFTNFLSTSLIAVRAWFLRGFMRQSLGSNSPSTRAQRILGLLVESGLIYFFLMSAACFIGNISIIIPRVAIGSLSELAFTVSAFAGMINQLMGIYPTSIIVLVSLGQTFTAMSTYHTSNVVVSRIRFAEDASRSDTTCNRAGDSESLMDDEVPRVRLSDFTSLHKTPGGNGS
ncbi:hypothetical protein D9758_008607 [Tetrapyrgos nigripes]|uniref:Uncharacterized protein n=1 Tax=Tetrapyrgos nigripes TaxID=182062 RepID=A0A8H5D6J6_9AGAR|nr:hypothetical protein D9758_008607 [Tetrapyrgos nigripes]